MFAARFTAALLLATLSSLFAGPALAERADARPVLVELFTSQGCYSCPPAEKYLESLKRRRADDVIALEFHVDYWNDLVWGFSGNWVDVHSKAEYTARQRRYAGVKLRGRTGVYTPQMVIGGTYAAVGSDRGAVERHILNLMRVPAPLDVVARLDGSDLRVSVAGNAPAGAAVWMARYLRESVTEITAGENKGKTLSNHNVVTELRRIGDWSQAPLELTVPGLALAEGQGCAVFVQAPRLGPVLGAARCL